MRLDFRLCTFLLATLASAAASPMFLSGEEVAARRPAKAAPQTAPVDLSGVWSQKANAITLAPGEPPMQAWAESKFRGVKPGYGPRATADSKDPILSCLPPGVPRIMLIPFPIQIVQVSGQVIMMFEYDHYIRQIYTNRKEHLKDYGPTWMGDSIGHWEGATLVVDTVGLNDKTWLDMVGHPHSDALHVVERVRRPDHDTLVDDITIDDARAYTKPWTGQVVYKLRPGWHLFEYICEDNKGQLDR